MVKEDINENKEDKKKLIFKIIFFINIILFILIIFIFAYYFYKTKINPDNPLSFNTEDICIIKQLDINQCGNALSNIEFEKTCSEIDSKYADKCYFEAAVKNFRLDICDKIKNNSLKIDCISNFNQMDIPETGGFQETN